MPILDELNYICKLNHDIFKVPICFINDRGEILLNHSESNHLDSINSFKESFMDQFQLIEKNNFSPVIWDSEYFINFSSIHVHSNNNYTGSIVIGPILYSAISDESREGFFNDLTIDMARETFVQYYDSIPILSKWNLTNLIQSINYMLYKEKLLVEKILQGGTLLNIEAFELGQPEANITERKQNFLPHADPLIEKKVINCIMNGKKDELEKIFFLGTETGEMGVLAKKSYLRSQKNLAIVGLTIGARASIDGGLHPEIAYALSDLFIQHLEELGDSKLVMRFLKKALLEFTDRVQRNNKQDFTKPINLCKNYIFSYIYEDLTLKKLADVSKISPSYLSALFKEEVGIPLSEYIQRAKVEEAINLMTYTHHSLLEISSLLNFNDQSYFTKVFKRYTGITPNQYKSGKKKNDTSIIIETPTVKAATPNL